MGIESYCRNRAEFIFLTSATNVTMFRVCLHNYKNGDCETLVREMFFAMSFVIFSSYRQERFVSSCHFESRSLLAI